MDTMDHKLKCLELAIFSEEREIATADVATPKEIVVRAEIYYNFVIE